VDDDFPVRPAVVEDATGTSPRGTH
jgi:hypothetical protein